MGTGIGFSHLTQNLRLAQYQRVQAAGHPHHVFQGLLALVLIEHGHQLVHRQVAALRQPGSKIRHCLVNQTIQFGTVTGGKQGRLAHPGHVSQAGQRRFRLLRGERQTFTQLHIRGGVIYANSD